VKCLETEWEFNRLAGVSGDMPEFMRHEPLPPYNTVFDISKLKWIRSRRLSL